MKNNLLFLFIAILFLNITAFAQSFTLKDSVDNNIYNGGNILVYGDTSTNTIKTHVKITNNSSTLKKVKVRRTISNLPTGSLTSFCWGACYPPATSTSTVAIDIAANTTDATDFEADYYPEGQSGTITVSYTFYNTTDATDSIRVNIIYNISVTGINEIISNNNISKPYPNPSNSVVNFNYKLDYNKTGYITIHNILGEQVKRVNLSVADNGEINISTSNLKSGAYFYSFIINGKSIKTGKLIINR